VAGVRSHEARAAGVHWREAEDCGYGGAVSDARDGLFLFVQCELPWALGPPDGRYLLRSPVDGEPERVIVLATLGARRLGGARGAGADRRPGRWAIGRAGDRMAVPIGRRRREAPPEPEPAPVPITRATIVDPVPVAAERQARAWLSEIDAERETARAFAALNRLLQARRIAAADPGMREALPAQALAIRAGWGEGEQLADSKWSQAVELPLGEPWRRARGTRGSRRPGSGRAAALRPDERVARLLSARERPLICEELALRARADLDQGRMAHAAIELDRALLAAVSELAGEQRSDLPLRVAELRSLRADVAAAAQAALDAGGAGASEQAGGQSGSEETLGHALERLQAALRARTAAGFGEP
jgi:hypothetical protein